MARRDRPAAALLALLTLGAPAAAQAPEPALPRVIYGEAEPRVIYGPASMPPERAVPPVVTPQAPPRPQPPPETSLTYGWVPVGPPVWYRPSGPHRPMPPGATAWGFHPAPTINNRVERPLPPLGRPLVPPVNHRPAEWRR